jgi:hypothetical protein
MSYTFARNPTLAPFNYRRPVEQFERLPERVNDRLLAKAKAIAETQQVLARNVQRVLASGVFTKSAKANPAIISVPANVNSVAAAIPSYATREGHFQRASVEHENVIRDLYLQGKKTSLTKAPDGKVSRVAEENLSLDFNRITEPEMKALLSEGRDMLKSFHLFNSGAGLWTRGGGQAKALVPFNLAELLSIETQKRLSYLSDLFNAKSPQEMLLMARRDVPLGKTEEQVAAEVLESAKAEIESILKSARNDVRAMTPVAMELVQAATLSRVGGTYMPYDIWTSEGPHAPIAEYLEHFNAHYKEMQFHPDPEVQQQIVEALESYIAESARRGETHLFGYQVGLSALHPETGAPIEGTPVIGEGAGRAKAYLDESGRTAQLQADGKTLTSFENIEVLTDWMALLGAHGRTGKEVSVVVVEQKPGYAGGNPFMVEKADGSVNFELHEQSALPPEFADGNHYFNSNTFVYSLATPASSNFGFESKVNGTQVRVKANAGDMTQERSTGGIGGRIGTEYQNFKTYPEYVKHGSAYVETFRQIWARDLAMGVPVAKDWIDAGGTTVMQPVTSRSAR